MFPFLESGRQMWESFDEHAQYEPLIQNVDGTQVSRYQQSTVWEEICGAISGDSQSNDVTSDYDDSIITSNGIKYHLEEFCHGLQNCDVFTRDQCFSSTDFEVPRYINDANELDWSEDDSFVLDLSTKNTNEHLLDNEMFKTSNVTYLTGCETANVQDNYTSRVCLEKVAFINNKCKYEMLPIYNISSSSNENEILQLMPYENYNGLAENCANSFSYQDSTHSEILDLSIPKNEKSKIHSEHVVERLELKYNEMATADSDLPDDLPDLRICDIKLNVPTVKSRSQRWIHFVRRRILHISTLRKMFGLVNEENTQVILLYGGRGLKNPLKSNIPSIANYANFQRKYICMYCDKEFKNHKVLSRHYTQHTTYRKLFCVICWKGFYDSYDLKRHLEKHQEITVFYCELCEAIYTQNVSKEDHYRNIHKNIYFSSS